MALRENYYIKTVDLRLATGMTPTALTEAYKRLKINFADEHHRGRPGVVKHVPGPEVRRLLKHQGFSFKSGQVAAFMMCKGGVGKTSSTLYTAQRLAAYGARVLAIDADPQGNLTRGFALENDGFTLDPETPVLADLVAEECAVGEAIVEVTESLHLIPSTPMNANLDGRIRERHKNTSLAFRRILKALPHQYDFVLFDCGPALNLTNVAAISASNIVVLPVCPDAFSELGLDQTLNEICGVEKDFGVKIDKRILFTRYDARELITLRYITDIAKKHDDKLFKTAIRVCADVKNAIAKNVDLFSIRGSTAKEDYDAFARELCGMRDAFIRKSKKSSAA